MIILDEKKDQFLTEEEFYEINSDEKLELIDNYAYALSAPSPKHQDILLELALNFKSFFKNSKCKVAMENEIKLKNETNSDIFIPDLSVLCQNVSQTNRGYEGIPSITVEILSKSNMKHDLITKLNKYQSYKVKEYWIVNPFAEYITIYSLNEEGKYYISTNSDSGIIKSTLFEDLQINLDDLFESIKY